MNTKIRYDLDSLELANLNAIHKTGGEQDEYKDTI